MNKTALIIVDAWKYPPDGDLERYGQDLLNDTKTFSVFLNNVCNRERNSGTIIIHSSGHPQGKSKDLVDEIELHPNDILCIDFNDMPNIISRYNLTKLYFCGFHFGHCIQNRIKQLIDFTNTIEFGIVLNLSILLPGDSWSKNIIWNLHQNAWSKDFSPQIDIPFYFWQPSKPDPWGLASNTFERIFIK